jgi:hypothetical protein
LQKRGLSHESFTYGQLQLINEHKDDYGLKTLLEDEGTSAREVVAYLQKI